MWLIWLAASFLPAINTCSDRRIHSDRPTYGTIESPSFPAPYAGGSECIFNLSTAPSNVVQLSFVTFDLAPPHPRSRQCLDAYVIVVVIDRQGKQHVGERFCGQTMPGRIDTMQSSVQIHFVTSTAGGGHRGFKLHYEFVSEASVREPESFISDPDYGEHCGGRSAAGQLTGEITSPGYPSTYPRNSTCYWLIRVEPRQRIYVRLVHFYLAATIAECDRASLTVMDGYKHDIPHRELDALPDLSETRFCGNNEYYPEEGMRSYISSANRLLIKFVSRERPAKLSENDDKRIGFKIVWTAVDSLLEDSASSASAEFVSKDECDQFVCRGGQVCIDQGQGICSTRAQLCIHNSLVCNGVQNCVEGDFSDEEHCYSREIVTASGASLVLLVVLVSLCVCCDQMRKRRRLREMVRERRSAQNGKASVSATSSEALRTLPPPPRPLLQRPPPPPITSKPR